MSAIISLAWKSLLNRKTTALLTMLTVAISVVLLIGVEKVRTQTKLSFANTISNTDLIVGARSGNINLLLYSVFRIGNATNNIDWKSYQEIINNPQVKWSIPISLGDSHKGFRVMGTNQDYFSFYQYGQKQHLAFKDGVAFENLFDVVLGSEVANKLGYHLNDEIILAHGISDKAFNRHNNLPFKIVGILEPTGTPVDKTVHVSLEAIEAIHVGWESGAQLGQTPSQEALLQRDFSPKVITAFMLGLNSKVQTFMLQRYINTYPLEPLSAIIPGIALSELWGMMSIAEQALMVIASFVVVAGLLGMLTSLLTGLEERRREMAILRSIGAQPRHVFFLLMSEASLLTFLGTLLGLAILYVTLGLAAPLIEQTYGIRILLKSLSAHELTLLCYVQLAGMVIGFIPALKAYRHSVADGMSIKL